MTWTDDPSQLIYIKENSGRGAQRVEQVDLTTRERSLLIEDGSAPSASPREPLLAYQTRVTALRYRTWNLDRRTSTLRELLDASWFDDVDNPTFSPDGSAIAFVGAGAGPLPGGTSIAPLLGIRPALAHDLFGAFYDLWLVGPDGGGLRRVTQIFDMQPEIAWSPSGRYIAVMGALQLQIVEVSSGARWSIPRPRASGPLSWESEAP